MNKQTPQPGSVSRGTMRPEDLISTFLDLVEQYVPLEAQKFSSRKLESMTSYWFLNDLIDMLDYVSPPGHYFGSHPGDGSDYGWWPIEGEDDEHSTDRPDLPD